MGTSPTPPNTPTSPLEPEKRKGYEDLYDTLQTAIENTADPDLLDSLNDSRLQVAGVITADNQAILTGDTAQFEALGKQIGKTNEGLNKLKAEIAGISGGLAKFAEVLGAIEKVAPMVGL